MKRAVEEDLSTKNSTRNRILMKIVVTWRQKGTRLSGVKIHHEKKINDFKNRFELCIEKTKPNHREDIDKTYQDIKVHIHWQEKGIYNNIVWLNRCIPHELAWHD